MQEYTRQDEAQLSRELEAAWEAGVLRMEPRVWRRRYLGAPAGPRVLLTGSEGEVPQAGVALRIVCDEERQVWIRRDLDPSSLGHGAEAWLSHFVGTEEGQAPVAFGLADEAGFRLALDQGYEQVRSLDLLAVDPSEIRSKGAVKEVSEVRSLGHAAATAWSSARGEGTARMARDRETLDWRFGGEPERGCRLGVVGDGAKGYAVYGVTTFDGVRAGWILDWCNPGHDPTNEDSLLAWLAGCAQADGVDLRAVFADTSQLWIRLQEAGFSVLPTSYFVMARSVLRRFDLRWLYWNWRYSLADLVDE